MAQFRTGDAFTIFPVNVIEEGARACIKTHERVHNAQTVFLFGGNSLNFTLAWGVAQLLFRDAGNPLENQAEVYAGGGSGRCG